MCVGCWLYFPRRAVAAGLLIIIIGSAGRLIAEERGKPEAVVVNLLNPCGVAVQPGSDNVFVSSRWGVYRYLPNYKDAKSHSAVVEIDGYPRKADIISRGSKYEVGPLGLAFLDSEQLVVGGGSGKAGAELVRIYKLPAKPPSVDGWMREDASRYALGPIPAGKDSANGEENFYGVAVGAGGIWVTCQGDPSKAWIAKAELADGKPAAMKPVITWRTVTQLPALGPITFTPDGKDLLVGQTSRADTDSDGSLLTFYNPADGSLKRSLKSGLDDVSGLAYSPKTGKLYATDFARSKPERAGLYQLTIGKEGVQADKMESLDKPSALAFDKEGHLYVTVFSVPGPPPRKGDDPGGLLYFKPGL